MDLDDFKAVLRNTGTDLWALIETAITVAARDHRDELRARRDGIVERLYVTAAARRSEEDGGTREQIRPKVRGVEEKERSGGGRKGGGSPSTPQSANRGDEEEEEVEVDDDDDEENAHGGRRSYSRPIDDEQTKILAIKEHIEDPDQEEDTLVNLLQNLADMDITFKALQETDIGRHVNGLRKHPSSEVRRLVKVLVRKWKDLVDEWVKLNSHETLTSAVITDGDSPQQISLKSNQSGNHIQVPEFGYSPNPHNGSSSSDRNSYWEPEPKAAKAVAPPAPPPRREPTPPTKLNNRPAPSSAPPKAREQKDSLLDPERLASARRRLHENYQEAQNAKKQRTIQVMDIHDIPKPRNSFFPRNKQQAKHR